MLASLRDAKHVMNIFEGCRCALNPSLPAWMATPSSQVHRERNARNDLLIDTSKWYNNLYFLALIGPVEAKDSAFIFDKIVKVTMNGSSPVARKSAGHDEVLLPIVFKDGTAEFTITYSWNLN